ncbi:two-component sensor histidine kinase [Oerskovia turbata]|uniref:histidine kinase n=1 Tax=Oerskovia turbata TaxID=1713 RepID=A0A4V1N4K4_9CELL|nr:histidine kinase [Oerskovia turbata]RXR22411.1 two-component sensor histidine kinase [Oerskovia turbata]RXR32476.1 two-component sensor histidine kinase [Oerskovia turbata]TGJ95771.1 two-component sensor histidine kinase [Actinotalea fermentans ATCC 43279 = JCM 9966 = DSM 3133]
MHPALRRAPVWAQDLPVALAVGAVWFGFVGYMYRGDYWMPHFIEPYWWTGAWLVGVLALRRVAPAWTFWVAVLFYPLCQQGAYTSQFHLAPLLVAGFGATREGAVPPPLAVLAGTLSGWALHMRLVRWGDRWEVVPWSSPSAVLTTVALALAAVALGWMVRRIAVTGEELRARNEELTALQGVLAQQAVLAERTRIARELHDVVAHHMSAIVVRAQAADRVAPNQPQAPAEAVTWIAEEGKKALTSMRSVVHVLRRETGDTPELAPAPALVDVRAAAARLTESGRVVELDLPDDLGDLRPEVSLAVVRIAQEGLTNVLLHSLAPRLSLEVVATPGYVRVAVRDPGPPLPDNPDLHGGNGLLNMRERALSCGGTLSAGPDQNGGWRVQAVLPREAS